MGMVLSVAAVDPARVEAGLGEDEMFALMSGNGTWELDKLWWIALQLIWPGDDLEALFGEPLTEQEGYTPVFRLRRDAVVRMAEATRDLDREELGRRVDRGDWRAMAMGPEPRLDDPAEREWLIDGADALIALVRQAAHEGHDVVTIVA